MVDVISQVGSNGPLTVSISLQPESDLNARVYGIGTKEIRYGVMAAIALGTGMIASQGLVATAILTGVVILTVYGIQAYAEKAFLDTYSTFPTATKVDILAQAHFWTKAIFASTLAGFTGTLSVAGAFAITIDNFLLKGIAFQLLAWIGLAPSAQLAVADIARFGNDASAFVKKFTCLSNILAGIEASGVLIHPALPAFLLKHYLSETLHAKKLFQAISSHQQQYGIASSIYFKCLAPILSAACVHEFVERDPTIDWPCLIEHLPAELLEMYTGAQETLEAFQIKF